jgi:DNA repair protein RadD
MKFTPRPIQEAAIQAGLNWIKKNKKGGAGIIIAPTSFGKSICVSEMARRLNEPVLVIQPSKELLEQNYAKYISYGEDAGIYSASFGRKDTNQVTFATIGSLVKDWKIFREMGVKKLIMDECHIASGKVTQTYEFCRNVGITHVIGLTATPVLLTGGIFSSQLKMLNRSRKSFYKEIIHTVQISEMLENNYWSKVNYKPIHGLKENMLRYNTTGTEFTEDSLRQFNAANNINDKVKLAAGDLMSRGRKHILVFVQFVQDAYDMSLMIPGSVVVHGGLSKKDREDAIGGFKSGRYPVAINVNVLGTGFDFSMLDAIIHARPTNSVGIWYQHVGRLVRIHPDKKDTDLIDFSGNFKRFGRVEDFTFEKDPKLGWGMFSGDRLLTNVDLNSSKHIFKEKIVTTLVQNVKSDYLWPIGTHKGKKLEELPSWYLDWVVSEKFIPTHNIGIEAKNTAIQFLNNKTK